MGRRAVVPVVFCLAMWAWLGFTYAPSLDHLPRADQWSYLVDTMDARDFGELFRLSYSYGRTRKVAPGDSDLFRPVLFTLLALEKTWFGTNFPLWQATGIALHGLVAALLFAVLLRLAAGDPGRTILAYAVAVFFALNFSILELVIWHHLHGYLLFAALTLASFLALQVGESSLRWRVAAKRVSWTLALLAAFTYELGQFYAVLAGIYVAAQYPDWKSRSRIFAMFAGILVLYQAVNLVDRQVHRGQFQPDHSLTAILEHAWSEETLDHSLRFVAFTLFQPFFPTASCWAFNGQRVVIVEPLYELFFQLDYKVVLSWLGLGAFGVVSLGAIGSRGMRRSFHVSHPLHAAMIPLGLWGLYSLINILGRMNLRPGSEILSCNSYYSYTALLFFLVAAAALWRAVAVPKSAAWVLAICLVASAWIASNRIHRVCRKLPQHDGVFQRQAAAIEAFVRQHRHEPDFRITLDLDYDRPMAAIFSQPFPVILFKRWIDHHRPKYVVSVRNGDVEFFTAQAFLERSPGREFPLLPDLIEWSSTYNLYEFRGRYFATWHWDVMFLPEISKSGYVRPIEGATAQECRQRMAQEASRTREDLKEGKVLGPGQDFRPLDEYGGFTIAQAGEFFYAAPIQSGPLERRRFHAGVIEGLLIDRSEAAFRARLAAGR